MDKRAQFITMVQTALLVKYATEDVRDHTAPLARPMWAVSHLEDAFAVAENLHPDVSAREAAEAFIRWTFQHTLEPTDKTILQILFRKGRAS